MPKEILNLVWACLWLCRVLVTWCRAFLKFVTFYVALTSIRNYALSPECSQCWLSEGFWESGKSACGLRAPMIFRLSKIHQSSLEVCFSQRSLWWVSHTILFCSILKHSFSTTRRGRGLTLFHNFRWDFMTKAGHVGTISGASLILFQLIWHQSHSI